MVNTPNNKLKKASQRKIEQAFIQLIQKKSLPEINITEIVQLAGVNRSTFYNNYRNVRALADKIQEQLENEVSLLFKDEVKKGYNSNDFLKIFRHVKENQTSYKLFFKLNYDKNYVVRQYDTEQAKFYFNDKFVDYHITFFKNGLNAIIKKWLDGGCKETPEEMADILRAEYAGREKF